MLLIEQYSVISIPTYENRDIFILSTTMQGTKKLYYIIVLSLIQMHFFIKQRQF